MNWLIRLGQWWESRRVIRYPEFKEFEKRILESQHIPQTINKEMTLIKARLDRLELLTGLKREPEAILVKDAARIQ